MSCHCVICYRDSFNSLVIRHDHNTHSGWWIRAVIWQHGRLDSAPCKQTNKKQMIENSWSVMAMGAGHIYLTGNMSDQMKHRKDESCWHIYDWVSTGFTRASSSATVSLFLEWFALLELSDFEQSTCVLQNGFNEIWLLPFKNYFSNYLKISQRGFKFFLDEIQPVPFSCKLDVTETL